MQVPGGKAVGSSRWLLGDGCCLLIKTHAFLGVKQLVRDSSGKGARQSVRAEIGPRAGGSAVHGPGGFGCSSGFWGPRRRSMRRRRGYVARNWGGGAPCPKGDQCEAKKLENLRPEC